MKPETRAMIAYYAGCNRQIDRLSTTAIERQNNRQQLAMAIVDGRKAIGSVMLRRHLIRLPIPD